MQFKSLLVVLASAATLAFAATVPDAVNDMTRIGEMFTDWQMGIDAVADGSTNGDRASEIAGGLLKVLEERFTVAINDIKTLPSPVTENDCKLLVNGFEKLQPVLSDGVSTTANKLRTTFQTIRALIIDTALRVIESNKKIVEVIAEVLPPGPCKDKFNDDIKDLDGFMNTAIKSLLNP